MDAALDFAHRLNVQADQPSDLVGVAGGQQALDPSNYP
jgi:hypothetical protein